MSLRNAQASNWVAERAEATTSAFDLKGSSKSYTSFSRAFSAGDTVFYSAHDEQGNREAGYGVFNGSAEITRNPTATLVNNAYNSNSPSKVSFPGEVTVACTFNASAFNTLWKALDAIDPDGDGGINIPPELIEGLVDTLNSKADQVDLEKEIQDRIDGDKALQDQIDALDPDGDLVIDWSEIEGKPSDYPPSSHGHVWSEITEKPTEFPPSAHSQGWDTITGKPADYPPSSHGHEIDEVNGLQDALDAAGGTPAWDDVTGKPTEFPPAAHTQEWSTITNTPSEYPPEAHTHEQGDVDGLESRLEAIEDSITSGGGFVDAPDDGKLYGRQSEAWAEVVIPDVADPDWSDIQNKPTEFPPSAHGHEIAEINGLDDALTDAGAPTAWDDVTGKPTEFPPEAHNQSWSTITDKPADYPPSSHGHAWGEITGKPSEFPPSSHTHLVADITDFDPADYQPVGNYATEQYVGDAIANIDLSDASLWEQNGNNIYYDSGNVGIGTDVPTVKLAVLGTNGDQLFLDNSGERFTQATLRNNGVTKSFWSYDLTTDRVDFYSSASLGFSTGGDTATQKVVIDDSGNVGIGTDNPVHAVDIDGNLSLGGANPFIAFTPTAGSGVTPTYIQRYGSDMVFYNNGTGADGTMSWNVGTGGVEAMRIDADGNVGIGTDNPRANLEIRDTGSPDLWLVTTSGANDPSRITTMYNNGGDFNSLHFRSSDFKFDAGGALSPASSVVIDASGRVGIGGEPSRSAGEIAKEAKDKLARWRSTFDERLKAEPKADKKAITLEITDDEFDTFPTEETLVERLQERNIGGGSAKLQVAGDGYFSGPVIGDSSGSINKFVASSGGDYTAIQQDGTTFNIRPQGSDRIGMSMDGVTGNATFSGTVNATTINGRVTDVGDHVKAITPTQIANWDAGTGGGGGGATTDGRISDTDIIHWNQAWDWGNHASAGYQPAGSYLTASDLSGYATESWVTSNYQPKGSYLTSSDLNGYATESWVNSQGFAKGSFVPTSGNTTISGTLTATDFVATSDERMKDDISPMPVGLIDDIKPVQWTWKDTSKKSAGVIAQQLQEIGLDDFVTEDWDGMLGVNYNALTSVLLAEVIALKKQVEELK